MLVPAQPVQMIGYARLGEGCTVIQFDDLYACWIIPNGKAQVFAKELGARMGPATSRCGFGSGFDHSPTFRSVGSDNLSSYTHAPAEFVNDENSKRAFSFRKN
jgi:hypothetical protein